MLEVINKAIEEIDAVLNSCRPKYDGKHPDAVFIKDIKHVIRNVGGSHEEVSRFHKAVNHLLQLTSRSMSACDSKALQHAREALNQEGLFAPEMVYQLKEDFEALGLLHSKHKKETKYLIEQSGIATQRNAKLRVENDELKAELARLKAKLK